MRLGLFSLTETSITQEIHNLEIVESINDVNGMKRNEQIDRLSSQNRSEVVTVNKIF